MSFRNQGSFRDPFASVYDIKNRVFRGIKKEQSLVHQNFLRSEFYNLNVGSNIVPTEERSSHEILEAGIPSDIVNSYSLWVEHQRLDFISYPYEWGFELLKLAGIFHLDIQLEALKYGYQLKDASSYNIQFIGCQPIFIDTPSFMEYKEGDRWLGYKQFCEHFLAPLALNSYSKVGYNSWLRGSPDGLNVIEISNILPWRSFLNLALLCNIHMHAWATSKVSSNSACIGIVSPSLPVPKKNLIALLESLKRCLENMNPATSSYWAKYVASNNSYSDEMMLEKIEIVKEFVISNNFKTVLDIGCNSGFFSDVVLRAGADRVIGLDNDGDAINEATKRPYPLGKKFNPILYDFANPSPSLGWNLSERLSLDCRLPTIDGVLCLALVHHMVIGKNIPIESFIDWLTLFSPTGIIEFVPKEDPMVAEMLAYREDVFPNYTLDNFIELLSLRAKITKVSEIKNSYRKLIAYKRNN
jgi:ribosomal protein L11 methylase PrmA